MFKVIVDGDACPRAALETVRRLAAAHGCRVVTVATFNHALAAAGPNWEHVVVGDEPEAADIAVANRTRHGDVVVTQDWGLAALALGRGAAAVSPCGLVYRQDRIAHLLEERAVKARFRRGGGRTKGPPARSRADDERFERALAGLLAEGGGRGRPQEG
jgi:uncharacterized protein YaiI (UPF0178 family)